MYRMICTRSIMNS